MGLGEIVKDVFRPREKTDRRGIHVCERPAIDLSWGEGTINTCDDCGRRMQVVNLGMDMEGQPQKAWRNV